MKMMRQKMIAIACAAALWAGLTACGPIQSQADAQSGATQKQQTAAVDASASASIKGSRDDTMFASSKDSKIAVIYFSNPERDDQKSVEGSTEYLADLIHKQTGADVYRIEPKKAYPVNHQALVAEAKAEGLSGARPELKDTVGDLSQYDTIFLGYPIWWGDLPMPVYTFLEGHDLAGKKVILFSTHGGSGLAGTVEMITHLENGADVVKNAYTISRDDVTEAAPSLSNWLKQLGY